ncbi:hypothetical protein C5167_040010 [Papaver somniferum]|uniref:GHMP kinase C-terminal domain-containing protein n=1 Tax=Papaver somniferum TaxID=3469 RepID=A0A4Y7IHX3_PAPSO|nr:hypothetical protein C5167_040010 [Papaver somniferum]
MARNIRAINQKLDEIHKNSKRFQEIVPLNAGNVLGAEDDAPALKWLSLIRQALNNTDKNTELAQNPPRRKEHKNFKTRISFSDLISLEDELDKEDLERHSTSSPNSDIEDEPSNFSMRRKSPKNTSSRYSLAANRLVKLVQEMQHSKVSKSENGTLFGAKITGGGSGGSVCILGRNSIQKKYKAATGFKSFVFEGSSPGAGEFGYLKIRRRFPPTEA